MLFNKIRAILSMPSGTEKSPFWQGESDFPSTENPYPPGLPEHDEWQKGREHGDISRDAW